MAKNKTPNPLHHTFYGMPDNAPNRATTRKYSGRTLAFRRVKRLVKEYTLRQHRVTGVHSFMVQLEQKRNREFNRHDTKPA